jgi:hypothetical protein
VADVTPCAATSTPAPLPSTPKVHRRHTSGGRERQVSTYRQHGAPSTRHDVSFTSASGRPQMPGKAANVALRVVHRFLSFSRTRLA